MPRNEGFKSRSRSTRGTWHNQKFEAIWTQSDKKLNSCCVALDLKGQDFWRTELSHSTRRKEAVNRWRLATHTTTTTTREAMPQHINFSELTPARRRLRLCPRAKWTLTFHRRVYSNSNFRGEWRESRENRVVPGEVGSWTTFLKRCCTEEKILRVVRNVETVFYWPSCDLFEQV